MEIGKVTRTIQVEPLELPAPLKKQDIPTERVPEPERIPVEVTR